jgi:hypothetical protein
MGLKKRTLRSAHITETVGWATAECARPRAQHASSWRGQRHSQLLVRDRALLRPRTGALRVCSLSNRLLSK